MMYLDAPPRPTCTNIAIGGANRDRLYVTESVTGTVLVADLSVLDTSLRGANGSGLSAGPMTGSATKQSSV